MVWAYAEKGMWYYWTKYVEHGAARQNEKRKTLEEVRRCSEGSHAQVGVAEEDARNRVGWR